MDIALFEFRKSGLKRNAVKSVTGIWPMALLRVEGVINGVLYGYDYKENVYELSTLRLFVCIS